MRAYVLLAGFVAGAGCSPALSQPDHPDARFGEVTDASALPDLFHAPGDDGGGAVCGAGDCYTVYAHADHILYSIDLAAKSLVVVGPFHAPQVGTGSNMKEDTITDLAVAPDSTIYVNSATNLYTADPADGHVTLVTSLGKCGNFVVALSFTSDGVLIAGDFAGDYCKVDTSTNPATITKLGTLGMGLALEGDLVAVADGTMYGTAYETGSNQSATEMNNILVKIDPTTGKVLSKIGSTGFPNLFGVAFAAGQVFGFTHDGTGRVITIDPHTGKGTLYGTFKDPSSGMGIRFAGAGVNPMVNPIP